jgi:hypothetical protein
MITMLLGGLWHGAAWGFVLWGAIHGTALVIEHQFRGKVRLPRPVAWFLVFNIVCLAWIPFRAPDLTLAGSFVSRFADWGPATMWTAPVVIITALVIGLQLLPARPMDALRVRFEQLHPVTLGASMACVILLVAATVSSQGVPPFIYFSF